jgi:hypothetical protein
MKFLFKHKESEILAEELVYKTGTDNSRLRLKLLDEQKNFCAYTEKYVSKIDSTEVEYFNPSIKNEDDYYNYYTTLRYANEQKISKYETYKNSNFFQSLFFQSQETFGSRIYYDDFEYRLTDETDKEADDLIQFLGLNDDYLYTERIKHVERLKSTIGDFTEEEKIIYFKRNKNDLSFPTAIENELKIDLSDLLH